MAAIKSLASVRAKYARVTPERTGDYEAGVKAPRADWAERATAAAPAYKAGVQAAITRNAFEQGVKKAGTAVWQGRATTVGVDRYGPGVLAGVAKYEAGFAPYRDVIERTQLPPRYPTGDARNYERVKAIGEALRKTKTGGGGA